MQLAPGIFKMDTGPFNWYLLEEAGRLTVVDAGFPGHFNALVKGLASLGRELSDIEGVILTHAHADHMGFAERLRRLTRAPVFVHHKDATAARSRYPLPWWGLLSHAYHPFMAGVLGTAVAHGLVLQTGIKEVRMLKGGETLDLPGRPVVYHLPGHTPGQIALHLPQRKVLLSGDTLITRDLITGKQGGPQLAHASLNWDSLANRKSLEQLRPLGKVLLLPGHGSPWSGSLEEALAEAKLKGAG